MRTVTVESCERCEDGQLAGRMRLVGGNEATNWQPASRTYRCPKCGRKVVVAIGWARDRSAFAPYVLTNPMEVPAAASIETLRGRK